MNILGISGFENSMRVKKEHWPGLNEREYRISQGHDSAAVLVKDGVVVAAAAEERFNREKHSARFPIGAIRYCLSEGGIGLQHVDELAHGFDYSPYRRAFSLDPKTAILFEEAFSCEALLARGARHAGIFTGACVPGQPSPGARGECLFYLRLGRVPGGDRGRDGGDAGCIRF